MQLGFKSFIKATKSATQSVFSPLSQMSPVITRGICVEEIQHGVSETEAIAVAIGSSKTYFAVCECKVKDRLYGCDFPVNVAYNDNGSVQIFVRVVPFKPKLGPIQKPFRALFCDWQAFAHFRQLFIVLDEGTISYDGIQEEVA